MPWHPQPIRPRPVLPGLVNKTLAHVEYHRTNHAPQVRRFGATGEAAPGTPVVSVVGGSALSGPLKVKVNCDGSASYIVHLLKRIVTVSLETMKIVDGLPTLDILE